MHNRRKLNVCVCSCMCVCVCVKFLKCQKVFAASPGIINSATFNKRQLRETDNARAREREREKERQCGVVEQKGQWAGSGCRERERDGAEAGAHVLGVAVGRLQLFAAITFK